MANAHFALVLHAHLPFIHHPEHDTFLEEDWLFEALTETYVPLLMAWERLLRDNVHFRITMSLTPPLLEMFDNSMLQQRYLRYLRERIELAEQECSREQRSDAERDTARHYLDRFRSIEDYYVRQYDCNIIRAFREFQDLGHLEVLACPATHGFLPLMLTPNAVRAQIEIGVATVARHMGRRPRGIWLSECAFRPGIDEVLAATGVEYFIVDAHGLLNAFPVPPTGVHAPVKSPAGVAVFGRDLESSKQVWSSEEGYPGDGDYREFYRDLGYDGSYEDIHSYLHNDGIRRNLGIKYHRVTGKVQLHEKQLYHRESAVNRAREHAGHFVFCRQHQLQFLKAHLQTAPIVVAPYDAELYGHWWYEGPEFLEQIFRTAQDVWGDFAVTTLSEYLDEHPPQHVAMPGSSSWGDKGYFEVWLNGANDWIYRHLHKAEKRMIELAQTRASAVPSPRVRAALGQAARELLLAQSSDWAFLMSVGTAAPYAEKRTRNHLNNFNRVHDMIRSGDVDIDYVERHYQQNPIFPDLDYRVYL